MLIGDKKKDLHVIDNNSSVVIGLNKDEMICLIEVLRVALNPGEELGTSQRPRDYGDPSPQRKLEHIIDFCTDLKARLTNLREHYKF